MHPNRLVVRAYVFRGARLWLGTRALITGAFLLASTNPVLISAAAIVGIIALSVIVGFLDTRRHRERAFLANMGVRPLHLSVLFAGPALLGELALRLVGASLS
jgi:hypothetical protein